MVPADNRRVDMESQERTIRCGHCGHEEPVNAGTPTTHCCSRCDKFTRIVKEG